MSHYTPHDHSFICPWCGFTPESMEHSAHARTHCPSCLDGVHAVDPHAPDDSACLGKTIVIAIAPSRSGGWNLIHRCTACDELRAHPVREDDNRYILIRTAIGPMSNPPFPLGMLDRP